MSEQVRTVLILDDDEVVRESLADFFEDSGWSVSRATTGEKALELLTREAPDAVVVDLRLPGMDGNAFIRAVSQTHPKLACVLCTGSPEYRPPADVAALIQVSEKVFSKPVMDLPSLEETLHRQIARCGERGSTEI